MHRRKFLVYARIVGAGLLAASTRALAVLRSGAALALDSNLKLEE
jgi:hypothetical protein